MKGLDNHHRYPAPYINLDYTSVFPLAFPDSEHLGATGGTHTLSCRPTILHCYRLGILHFPLGTTLYTVCLHWLTSCFRFIMNDTLFMVGMSIASSVNRSSFRHPMRHPTGFVRFGPVVVQIINIIFRSIDRTAPLLSSLYSFN